jgi:hypothetical protein
MPGRIEAAIETLEGAPDGRVIVFDAQAENGHVDVWTNRLWPQQGDVRPDDDREFPVARPLAGWRLLLRD